MPIGVAASPDNGTFVIAPPIRIFRQFFQQLPRVRRARRKETVAVYFLIRRLIRLIKRRRSQGR
jgi:hypothetical protein